MSENAKRFHVIKGGGDKKPYAKTDSSDLEQLTCRTCENDIGVASSTFIETCEAPMERGGEIVRSTKGLICARCMSRGKFTIIM